MQAPRNARSSTRRVTPGSQDCRRRYSCITTRTVLRASARAESFGVGASMGGKTIRFRRFDQSPASLSAFVRGEFLSRDAQPGAGGAPRAANVAGARRIVFAPQFSVRWFSFEKKGTELFFGAAGGRLRAAGH